MISALAFALAGEFGCSSEEAAPNGLDAGSATNADASGDRGAGDAGPSDSGGNSGW
jgi:hypothetical protein